MNLTIPLSILVIIVLAVDVMHLCYRAGKEEKQERLEDKIDELRLSIKRLTELQNNIESNFPNLDLKTMSLEDLLYETSGRDYKRVYEEAYKEAYYDALNAVSREYRDMQLEKHNR